MKTADIPPGPLLAYWVARARKLEGARIVGEHCEYDVPQNTDSPTATNTGYRVLGTVYAPHEDWNDCGPLIAEFKIAHWFFDHGRGPWHAQQSPDGDHFVESEHEHALVRSGPTPQIAICRAVVASVFGEEVDDE